MNPTIRARARPIWVMFLLVYVIVLTTTQAAAGEALRPFEIGTSIRFMPAGPFALVDPWGRTFRALPAFGVSPYVAFRLFSFLSVGAAVDSIYNVIPNRSDYSVGTLYAASLRLEGRYATGDFLEFYGAILGGYSHISLSNSEDSSGGPVATGLGGFRVRVSGRQKLLAELGYYAGFQRNAVGDYAPSYLVLGVGWQIELGTAHVRR